MILNPTPRVGLERRLKGTKPNLICQDILIVQNDIVMWKEGTVSYILWKMELDLRAKEICPR